MKHPHYATIVAWAEGKKVQVKGITDGKWHTTDVPSWSLDREYRVKPDGLQYRIGLYKVFDFPPFLIMCITEDQVKFYEKAKYFVKWITDWQEVEVGE